MFKLKYKDSSVHYYYPIDEMNFVDIEPKETACDEDFERGFRIVSNIDSAELSGSVPSWEYHVLTDKSDLTLLEQHRIEKHFPNWQRRWRYDVDR